MRSAPAQDFTSQLVEGALLAVVLLPAAWLLVALLGFEYGLDQGIYAVVSDTLLNGGIPYRDAWDFKPPGIFFAYALARGVLGEGMQAVRVLEALGFASLVIAFAIYSKRFVGSTRPGLLGGALAVAGHVWLGFWQTAQPESFAAVLVAWALVLATVEPRAGDPRGERRQALAWFGAGALYAAAALLKPPLGGGILVSAGLAARRAGRDGVPGTRGVAFARPLVAFGAGAALPLAATLVLFAARGGLEELAEALLLFAPEYTKINVNVTSLPVFAFRSVEFLLFRFSLVNTVGIALLVLLPPLAGREREGAIHVLGLLAILLAGIAIQGRFFPYHYGTALPLASLLAGWGLWKLTRITRRSIVGAGLVVLVLVFLANANGVVDPIRGSVVERVRVFDKGRVHNLPKRRVAALLAAYTQPDASIYVWGFEPVLYDLAQRRPASRYVYNAPLLAPWFRARARPRLMKELRRDPPAAIVVQRGDVHPGTSGVRVDSATALRRFPELRAFIQAFYEPVETVGDFTIHLPKPG
jgi:hypothetical protein